MAQPTLKEILQGVPQAARTLKALGKNAVKPIYDDYSQLWGKGSNIRNDAELLKGKLGKMIPPQSAFSDPQAMQEWSLAAALNAPMGLGLKGKLPATEFSKAHEIAQRNAALPIEQGGLGLPPNNTAMDRARALGFETAPKKELYHSSRKEWGDNNIDVSKSDLGFHIGTLEQATNRLDAFGSRYGEFDASGGNIIPILKSKYSYTLPLKDEGSFHADSVSPQLEKKKLVSKGYTKKILNDPIGDSNPREWDRIYDEKMRDILRQNDYQGFHYNNEQEGSGKSYGIIDPSVIRSRFAAFDPMKKDSANILASILGGTALASQYQKDKKKR